MDKLIELLQQIQELAGVAVDALHGAGGGHEGGKPGGPPHGGPPHGGGHGGPPEGSPAEERGEPPAEAKSEGDRPGFDGDKPKQY